MLGGKIKTHEQAGDVVSVHYTAEAKATDAGTVSLANLINPSTKAKFVEDDLPATAVKFINVTKGYRGTGTVATGTVTLTANDGASTADEGDIIRLFWVVEKENTSGGNTAVEISISPDTFPGTYKIVGDTFIRNTNGKDYPFQMVINKAKNLVA